MATEPVSTTSATSAADVLAERCSGHGVSDCSGEAAATGVCSDGSPCDSENPCEDHVDGAHEPCPTPLSWQHVLAAFVTERREAVVEVEGHRVVGWCWGDPANPPMILLGGLTGTPEQMCLTAHLLRERYHVVVMDDPPVDERGPRYRSLTSFAQDVLAVADAAVGRGERFSLMGFGWGAMVGLRTMLDAPGRVERAVLVGGYARLPLSLFERVSFGMARWWPGRLGYVPMQATMTEQNHRRWFPPFDHSRWDFLATETNRVPLRIVGARASSVRGVDLRDRLPAIETPVLLVRGEGEGAMATARQEELASGLPVNRVEWMHSSGHLPHVTHPHRLWKLVRTFADETATG